MEIVLNNLSLTGQYNSPVDFADNGLFPIISLLVRLQSSSVCILKNYSFYSSSITSTESLYDILTDIQFSRTNDIIRRYKSLLSSYIQEPFWEDTQKHNIDHTYTFENELVTGESVAEACERDRLIISFIPSKYNTESIEIIKNGKDIISLNNLLEKNSFLEYQRKQNFIDFESYIKVRFNDQNIDFSRISKDKNKGLNYIPNNDQEEFINTFRIFSELDWIQIGIHDGLKYKPYTINRNNKRFFIGYEKKGIYEFRASSKFRCFGFKDQDKFVLLFIDLEHKLGNI